MPENKFVFLTFSEFGPFFRHYSNFLAESSKLHSKGRNAFRGSFLGRFFCYFWAWSKKIWSFVEEFLAGFSNFILGVHRNFLGIIYFSRKSRFFSIVFEYWVKLFWRVCHSSRLRVQMHFRKNNFFWQKFFTLSDIEREFFRRLEKNIGGVLRRQSTRPKKRLLAKVCWKENLLFHRFRTLRKWFFALWKKMAKCQNWNLRVHGNSLMKTFVWKILVFLSFFGHFEIIFRPLAESFSKPLSALLFNCPEEHCAEIVFWKKSVFPLLTRSKKTFGNLSHI